MHGDKRKLSKKKGSKLTVKHHGRHIERCEKVKAQELAKEGIIQKQGERMKKRKSKVMKKAEKMPSRKKSAWKSFWKKYFSF